MKNSAITLLLLLIASSLTFAASGDLGAAKGANGSETSPWLIEDFDDFNAFCNDSSKWAAGQYTRLEANIDLDPNLPSRVIYTQAPIAGDSDTDFFFEGTAYAGSFDGNNHVINNLHINGAYYCGLFGKTDSGSEISNLGIENASITGSGGNLGGLCGENSGTIANCYAASSVTGRDSLGGLCGTNTGTISNCYATGTVSGGGGLGGLCGCNWDGIIANCYAAGSVTGRDSLGGLCGTNTGTISNCYATGSVSGGDASFYLGGLCGDNKSGSISNCYATGSVLGGDSSHFLGGLCGDNESGTISNCYANGSVSGDRYLGGLCGYQNGNNSLILNCFWDTQTTGITIGVNQDSSYPGTVTNLQGLTTAQMQDINTFLNTDWDFVSESANGTEELWHMPYQTTGYPMLFFQRDIPGDHTGSYGVNLEDFGYLSKSWQDSYTITDLQTIAQFWLEQ